MIKPKLTEQEYHVMAQLMQLGLGVLSEKMSRAYAEYEFEKAKSEEPPSEDE